MHPKFLRWGTEKVIESQYFEQNYIPKIQSSVLWVLSCLPGWILWLDMTAVPVLFCATTLRLRVFLLFSCFVCFHSAQWAISSPPMASLNFLPFFLSVYHSTSSCNKVSISIQNHRSLFFPPWVTKLFTFLLSWPSRIIGQVSSHFSLCSPSESSVVTRVSVLL